MRCKCCGSVASPWHPQRVPPRPMAALRRDLPWAPPRRGNHAGWGRGRRANQEYSQTFLDLYWKGSKRPLLDKARELAGPDHYILHVIAAPSSRHLYHFIDKETIAQDANSQTSSSDIVSGSEDVVTNLADIVKFLVSKHTKQYVSLDLQIPVTRCGDTKQQKVRIIEDVTKHIESQLSLLAPQSCVLPTVNKHLEIPGNVLQHLGLDATSVEDRINKQRGHSDIS